MTGFWVGATLLALLALALLCWPRRNWRVLLAVLPALAVAGALYFTLGDSKAPQPSAAEQAARAQIAVLQAATRERPGDAEAWLNLGEAYGQLQQHDLAVTTLTIANRLSAGRNVAVLAALAEAMVLDANGANDQQVEPLFERALQLEPRNAKALFYTGLTALNRGELQLARERFSAMLGPELPEAVRTTLNRQIAALDEQLAAGSAALAADATTVRLHISVAAAMRAEFAARAAAGATLYVFARAPAGGPPLAARRLTASVPVDVALNAGDAMLAGNAIKPRQPVSVAARLSASGSPTAQAGDLFGEALTTAGSGTRVAIVIDKVAR
jgi:cytochrome c-type biogenesis protein CcmH